MEVMPKVTRRPSAKKNGIKPRKVKQEEKVSELGRILRKLSDKYAASGGRLYSIEEIQREVEQNRIG